jgi:hypothetical protein
MTCSSAASERVWSIYRFIHSRLHNRLANEKVKKLAFIYVNCAILDTDDQTDYMISELLLMGCIAITMKKTRFLSFFSHKIAFLRN